MNRLKGTLLAIVIATVAIVPATAFAAGGHHGHHGKFQAYRGTVAAPTATSSPLVVSVTHGSDMTFVLTLKTRYILDHQRLTKEPSFTMGERVVVKARELKNGTFVARAVRAMTKKA
jgi:hypothetical protein